MLERIFQMGTGWILETAQDLIGEMITQKEEDLKISPLVFTYQLDGEGGLKSEVWHYPKKGKRAFIDNFNTYDLIFNQMPEKLTGKIRKILKNGFGKDDRDWAAATETTIQNKLNDWGIQYGAVYLAIFAENETSQIFLFSGIPEAPEEFY